MTVATLIGKAALATAAWFDQRRAVPDPNAMNRFCAVLRQNAQSLPCVYYTDWVDRWLMGNLVPGPNPVAGFKFQATCLTPSQAVEWADHCGHQFPEQVWLAARLHEASTAWDKMTESISVVVIREVVGASPTDEEILAAADVLPSWLTDSGTASIS